MRVAAGYFSAVMLLVLIGYMIGYFVCLWRYQPSPEGQLTSGTDLPHWLEENRIELEKRTGGTIVMPELDIPDDWEPPPMLPGD